MSMIKLKTLLRQTPDTTLNKDDIIIDASSDDTVVFGYQKDKI